MFAILHKLIQSCIVGAKVHVPHVQEMYTFRPMSVILFDGYLAYSQDNVL